MRCNHFPGSNCKSPCPCDGSNSFSHSGTRQTRRCLAANAPKQVRPVEKYLAIACPTVYWIFFCIDCWWQRGERTRTVSYRWSVVCSVRCKNAWVQKNTTLVVGLLPSEWIWCGVSTTPCICNRISWEAGAKPPQFVRTSPPIASNQVQRAGARREGGGGRKELNEQSFRADCPTSGSTAGINGRVRSCAPARMSRWKGGKRQPPPCLRKTRQGGRTRPSSGH